MFSAENVRVDSIAITVTARIAGAQTYSQDRERRGGADRRGGYAKRMEDIDVVYREQTHVDARHPFHYG